MVLGTQDSSGIEQSFLWGYFVFLNRDEEADLKGENGEARRISMRVLARLGESLGADKLIPITSAHVVESSYQIACDAGMDLLEKLANLGAKCSVLTTSDPAAIDLENWRELKVSDEYARKQLRLAELLNRLNVVPTFNCTPYADVNVPKFGDNVAWSESNAVVYVNSVYGARTNRYPAFVDLFAAIIGKVPNFGLHLTENRRGRVLVKLDVQDFGDSDSPVLGTYLGLEMGEKIPVLTGFPRNVSATQLKGIGAAGAAAGALAMYHIEGLTPEARTRAEAFQGDKPEETMTVDRTVLARVREKMCTVAGGKVDIVGLGCPHASVFEIGEIVRLLNGRRVKKGIECWVCTSRLSKGLADKMGYSDKLSAAGVRLVCDTCCNDAPMKNWKFKLMATNSGKFARYAPVNVGSDVVFGSTKQCIDAAVKGEFPT